jgi:hypothetical protein
MLFVRWMLRLVSLPLAWVGLAAAALKAPLCVPLLKAAWIMSGSGETGRAALSAVRQHRGLEAARGQAAVWLARRPRPEIAAAAGLFAAEAGDLDDARRLLARGRESGTDRTGMLDLLEFTIVLRSGESAPAVDLARRFELRRDLPPLLSQAARTELLWDAMLNGRFEEAERRAASLLAVNDVAEAELALWALALRRGDAAAAARHLATTHVVPAAQSVYWQVLGLAAIGRTAEALAGLEQMRDLDATRAGRLEQFLRERHAVE